MGDYFPGFSREAFAATIARATVLRRYRQSFGSTFFWAVVHLTAWHVPNLSTLAMTTMSAIAGDGKFHFAIDRGGTFTDVYCRLPDGTEDIS